MPEILNWGRRVCPQNQGRLGTHYPGETARTAAVTLVDDCRINSDDNYLGNELLGWMYETLGAVAAEDISDWGGWRSKAVWPIFALRYAEYQETFSWHFGLCIASTDYCFGSQLCRGSENRRH